MCRISVIIPNYNRAQVIGMTLQNMLSQTQTPYEVIVVDDGSTDDSVEIIRSFGDLVCLLTQPNQGPGAARNTGLEAATGDYIQFMDSDDLASANKLELQLAALQHSGADFAYGAWVRTEIEGDRFRFVSPVLQGAMLPSQKPMLEWQLGNWCTIFQSCLFRRSALEAAGRYPTDMRIAEDGDYLVRILRAGAVPVFTKDCLVFYRSGSTSHQQISGMGSSAQRQAEDLTRYFGRIGEYLASDFTTFHPSTRRSAALKLYRHQRYCQQQGWATVSLANPSQQWIQEYPNWRLQWWDWRDRFQRKLFRLSPTTPQCAGLRVRKPNQRDYAMAMEIGLTPC